MQGRAAAGPLHSSGALRQELQPQEIKRALSGASRQWVFLCSHKLIQSLFVLMFNVNASVSCSSASPKLFLESSSPCTSMPNMHSSLHSPLTRQLSTSSENSTPLGAGSQSIPNTPVRKLTSTKLSVYLFHTENKPGQDTKRPKHQTLVSFPRT